MKKMIIILISIVILIFFIRIFTCGPIISCRIELPAGYIKVIESQSKGQYSDTLPLIPVYVSVDCFCDGRVYYTVHYFPLGSVGYSFMDSDGFNIEKPLTGL